MENVGNRLDLSTSYSRVHELAGKRQKHWRTRQRKVTTRRRGNSGYII
jgi:hypothetical protein